jgi:negative regulator of sigma E activity
MSAANEHPVETLSAFLDGEVTDRERGAIESHLAACAPCRDLLDDLRCLDRAVADDEPPPVPADLVARIRDAVAAESVAPAPVTRRWDRGLPLAAAACLLAAGAVWLLRLQPPRPAAPAPSAPGPTLSTGAPAVPRDAPVPSPPPPPASPKALERKRSDLRQAEKTEARKQTAAKEKAVGGVASAQVAPQPVPPPSKDAPPAGEMLEQLRSLGYIGNGDKREAAAVEAPPYRVRLLEDRLMSVETAGYTCAVQVSQEDATTLAAIVRSLRTPREGTMPTAAAQAPPSATAGGVGAPQAAVAVAPRICAQLSPEDCRFVLNLIRDRYRGALEQRCGPPPR